MVRREAVAREQRGEQTVARAMADVQRLHHRAEVGLDAGGERRGDRERGGDLVVRQLQQLRARSGGAEDAERRGRVPAVRVVIEVHAQRELALGLEAGDVGGDEIAAARADVVREREQRRQDRRRRMAADRVVAVVEIERVRGGAVHERGVERADARRVAAEHERGPGAALRSRMSRGIRVVSSPRPRGSRRRSRGCRPSPNELPLAAVHRSRSALMRFASSSAKVMGVLLIRDAIHESLTRESKIHLEYLPPGHCRHSSLSPSCFTSLPYLATSLRTCAPNCSGLLPTASAPSVASLSFTSC